MTQERRQYDSKVDDVELKLLEHIKICDRDIYGKFGFLERLKPIEETVGGWKGAVAIIAFFLLFILGGFVAAIFNSIADNSKKIEQLKDAVDTIKIDIARQSTRYERSERNFRAGNAGIINKED